MRAQAFSYVIDEWRAVQTPVLETSKLRQLGFQNRIAKNLDSKLSKFGRQFNDHFDFNDKIRFRI